MQVRKQLLLNKKDLISLIGEATNKKILKIKGVKDDDVIECDFEDTKAKGLF